MNISVQGATVYAISVPCLPRQSAEISEPAGIGGDDEMPDESQDVVARQRALVRREHRRYDAAAVVELDLGQDPG